MRLEQYMIESTWLSGDTFKYKKIRSKSISEDAARKILHTKCTKALKDYQHGGMLYRGLPVAGIKDEFRLTNPTKSDKRSSAYASGNYYTTIINNDPLWGKFPQREVICTTDLGNARGRGGGNAYMVLPFNGFKIGLCPDDDIFFSFRFRADRINDFLDDVFSEIAPDAYRTNDWNILKKAMVNISREEIIDLDFSTLCDEVGPYPNLYKFIMSVITPENFELLNSLPKKKHREAWTDSPCLLIKVGEKGGSSYDDKYIDKIV
jgi:phage pi2 protein 07